MKLLAGAYSDKGVKRSKNEDFFCVDEKAGLMAVADGMGGHASGEIASRMVIEVLSDYINSGAAACGIETEGGGEALLAGAIKMANSTVYGASQDSPSLRGMGSTLVVALIRGERLNIAHVGDSRIYLIRAGCIEQLTDDHSLISEQLREGLISEEDAKKSSIGNIITRSMGVGQEVEADFSEMSIADGDIIILCSDGITTMLSDETILSETLDARSPSTLSRRLVDLANEAGGSDNITLVAIYIYKSEFSHYTHKIKKLFGR
ncbi:MAG: Stp1/IreP family PP2C-type Ser/Thr phosphatase [Proteobacteria bacterium]|nr:Stp1/IreP family PP2C-type Ser/Thr phosphatase [Pseudomonadota bacterium]